MDSMKSAWIRNGRSLALRDLPRAGYGEFREAVLSACRSGDRLSALFAVPERMLRGTGAGRGDNSGVRLFALLASEQRGSIGIETCTMKKAYPALTPECPQAWRFENEIRENWGILPEGHPWPRPVRRIAPLGPVKPAGRNPGAAYSGFFSIHGAEIHEVAVGPVHAGVIEPGHFRFQCHGENVYHLEISLGYQHRGLEKALTGGPDRRTLHYMETAAGDTTAGHALAYAQIMEGLSGTEPAPRSAGIRGIALELERVANHVGDLGALSGDVGYLPTASYCGRLRGDILNMTALLCGNRFGRGLILPGGTGFDADEKMRGELLNRLSRIEPDVGSAVNLLWDKPSVMARLENTGILPASAARELGIVGPAARACGIRRDVRSDFPLGIYQFSHIPDSIFHTGDVYARAMVRWLEIQKSFSFVREQLESPPEGPVLNEIKKPRPGRLAVSLVEGWRGEICHAALTGTDGRFIVYKIVDPSFHNWFGLAMAMRGQAVSDFPLCNKSFNLSYCGHDL